MKATTYGGRSRLHPLNYDQQSYNCDTTHNFARNVALIVSAGIFPNLSKMTRCTTCKFREAPQHTQQHCCEGAHGGYDVLKDQVHPNFNLRFETFGFRRWLIVSSSGCASPVVPTFDYLVWQATCSAGPCLFLIFYF